MVKAIGTATQAKHMGFLPFGTLSVLGRLNFEPYDADEHRVSQGGSGNVWRLYGSRLAPPVNILKAMESDTLKGVTFIICE